jgi:hypothetical protein
MVFGIALHSFVFFHTLITLVAIASGLVMLFGMLGSRAMPAVHAVFLLFSVLTAITGFMIQITPSTPAVKLGVILSVVLIVALAARYVFRMAGTWRWIYAAAAVLSLYLNCFVLVVQAFLKVPALHALAPAGSGPVFGGVQGAVLLFFVVTGFLATRRFHPA